MLHLIRIAVAIACCLAIGYAANAQCPGGMCPPSVTPQYGIQWTPQMIPGYRVTGFAFSPAQGFIARRRGYYQIRPYSYWVPQGQQGQPNASR